jgi:hypothetical protein
LHSALLDVRAASLPPVLQTTNAGRAPSRRTFVLPKMPNHKLKRQKKMGETPIILLPVVAPEPHIKSRTPSDSAIVAIFHDKRKPPTDP